MMIGDHAQGFRFAGVIDMHVNVDQAGVTISPARSTLCAAWLLGISSATLAILPSLIAMSLGASMPFLGL